MADTENAAATATNPAEVPKAESSDLKAEVKPTTSTEAPADSKSDDKPAGDKPADGEEKWALNGASGERRSGRNDRKDDRKDDRNGRDDRDRRGGQRGRGRGRGGFQNKRCELARTFACAALTRQTGATKNSTTCPRRTTRSRSATR
jgi:lupus La protein